MQRRLAKLLWKLGILCVLSGVFLSVVYQAQSMALQATRISNLKLLGRATQEYAESHRGTFPPLENRAAAQVALRAFTGKHSREIWSIPGEPDAFVQPNPALSRKPLEEIKYAEKVILFYEPYEYIRRGSWHGVVFADGHAKMISAENWPGVAREGGIPFRSERKIAKPLAEVLLEGTMLIGLEMLAAAAVLWPASLLTRKKG